MDTPKIEDPQEKEPPKPPRMEDEVGPEGESEQKNTTVTNTETNKN